jgi:hypothetical protein
MKNYIYIITSLPRTGTTSLCQMADICGLKSIHVLKNKSFKYALNEGYNFFADTPFYDPEFLIGILECEMLDNIKFIYSHRETMSHQNSINKFLHTWQPPKKIHNKIGLLDKLCYNKLNQTYIENHYNYIKKISFLYNIDMLDYKLNEGWKPFCSFINKPIPNVILPHKNKL